MNRNLIILILLVIVFPVAGYGKTIKISGPPVMESLPFALMSGMEIKPGVLVEFIPWNSPDQIRAMIAGKQIDCGIITTHASAVFASKGVDTKIAAMFEDSLWIVSDKNKIFDEKNQIKGKFLFPFGPGEMPELILNASLGSLPVGVEKIHTGGAFESVNLLLLKRGDHALLSEPSASIAVLKSKRLEKKIGVSLVKVIDLKEVWRKKYNNRELLLSCFSVFNESCSMKSELKLILDLYEEKIKLLEQDQDRAFNLISKKFPVMISDEFKNSTNCSNIRIRRDLKSFENACFFLDRINLYGKKIKGLEKIKKDLFMETD